MAADLMQSFVGRHIEKIVLGTAAAVLVAGAVLFVSPVGRKSHESVRTGLKTKIELIQSKKQDTKLDEILTPADKKSLGVAEEPPSTDQFKQGLALLPGTWPRNLNTHKELLTTTIVEVRKVKKPERIMTVEDVETAVGRGVTTEPKVPNALAQMTGKNVADIAWVGCVGRFDLTAQLDEYLKAKCDPEIILTRVDLQRRTMSPDGQWGDWEPVTQAIPAAVADKLPKKPANPKDKAVVFKWWTAEKDFQATIRRPSFYPLAAVDTSVESKTVADIAGTVTGVEQPRIPAPTTRPADGTEEGDAPPGPPPPGPPPPAKAPAAKPGGPSWAEGVLPEESPVAAPAKPAEAHVMATVWANDTSVKPGGVYQYRMRVAVFNPTYSQQGVGEDVRWLLELEGGWSEPSPKVRIPELVQFFFLGAFGDKANIELHRWIHGQWIVMPSLPSNIGAPVIYVKKDAKLKLPGGATGKEDETMSVDLSPGIVLVDMVRGFTYYPAGNKAPTKTNVLIYAGARGTLAVRTDWDDRAEAAKARAAHEGVAPPPATKAAAPSP
jgi:hypothetical protein